MNITEFVNNFANQFEETPSQSFKPETQFRDVKEWDSMLALSIMAMVDEKYNVKVTPDEMKNSITINDLFLIISSKK